MPIFSVKGFIMNSAFNLESQHEDIDSKIAAAIERLSQAYRVLLWRKNKEHTLSPIQIQILVFLLQHGKALSTVGQLAREFSLTPATVSDAINSLAKKGLAIREKKDSDQRIISVLLTAQGRKTARKLSTWADIVRERISQIEADDKLAVMQFLMQLIDSLQQEGVITVARMCITCNYFQMNSHPKSDSPYRCQLLNKPLARSELRLDCLEHAER